MSEPISVSLTWAEAMQAALCGVGRHVAAMKANRKPRIETEDCWRAHIEGAGGEMAFAKLSGMYWGASINTFKAPDVGAVQVRTRPDPRPERQDLIVRDDDADDEAFVLVTGSVPHFVVHGWLHGRDAKQARFRSGRPPAYFVPKGELRELRELIALCELAW